MFETFVPSKDIHSKRNLRSTHYIRSRRTASTYDTTAVVCQSDLEKWPPAHTHPKRFVSAAKPLETKNTTHIENHGSRCLDQYCWALQQALDSSRDHEFIRQLFLVYGLCSRYGWDRSSCWEHWL